MPTGDCLSGHVPGRLDTKSGPNGSRGVYVCQRCGVVVMCTVMAEGLNPPIEYLSQMALIELCLSAEKGSVLSA
jgi:hypothetical protein